MHRLSVRPIHAFALLALAGALGVGCGEKKPAAKPETKAEAEGAKEAAEARGEGDDKGEPDEGDKPKKDECVGFEIGNLEEVLMKSACEETAKPDSLQPVDLKGKLEVTVAASPTAVAPGARADLLVAFANKSKEPLTLHFRVDPVPRFEVEAYDAKTHKRVDMPAGKPPPPPKGASAPPASEAKSARVTLAPNGTARARIPWEAVKTKWAPEKVRGTPPERGYPRSPAGPLKKGKVVVKVLTPLVGVFEGVDKEVSAPKVELEIGG